ncbi:MAG: hypothetical protein IPJ38_06755 [Dechloromonas sp.]|uniref:Uncharacterized protein n=1 Tax=Candidatus Dechloromonas phosphorivorans TaxID=2899244 RepID=A0A935K9T7_9RHOO|nr:hypothetical protein [Candidatus Dechloromonas phosphorivorans]
MSLFNRPALVCALAVTALLAACASEPPAPPPKESVNYIDTTSFDRSLSSSLNADLETIEIPVTDRMSPVAIPDRLNKWLSAVDANGGNIQVKQIPDEQGKQRGFPIAVIGLAIEVVRLLRGTSEERLYKPAANYDADIMVRQGPNGERIIDRVLLKRRVAP